MRGVVTFPDNVILVLSNKSLIKTHDEQYVSHSAERFDWM